MGNGPSEGLWWSGDNRQGIWTDSLAALPLRLAPRDMRMPESRHDREGQRRGGTRTQGHLPPVTEASGPCFSGMLGMKKTTLFTSTEPLRPTEGKRFVQGHRWRQLWAFGHSQVSAPPSSAPPTLGCQTHSYLSPPSLDPL